MFARKIDQALFFSDLDSTVREWSLPALTAQVPTRTYESFTTITAAEGWISLSTIAEQTDQSKSTVIRHVNDLEEIGVIESDTREKTKLVRASFSGELFELGQQLSV